MKIPPHGAKYIRLYFVFSLVHFIELSYLAYTAHKNVNLCYIQCCKTEKKTGKNIKYSREK